LIPSGIGESLKLVNKNIEDVFLVYIKLKDSINTPDYFKSFKLIEDSSALSLSINKLPDQEIELIGYNQSSRGLSPTYVFNRDFSKLLIVKPEKYKLSNDYIDTLDYLL